ncbi:protein NSP-INTERACTING KINASE 3-like [Rhododendron vialii]|uniref:protein NSP-INTERACTING KINASE 3-like n=1 Tax=Rhododendron vialii TaxID=182163 RepID=UPI00265ED731|nr:protein NSP-INTERACTING KINASE 3-like [Rhododendron vialii]
MEVSSAVVTGALSKSTYMSVKVVPPSMETELTVLGSIDSLRLGILSVLRLCGRRQKIIDRASFYPQNRFAVTRCTSIGGGEYSCRIGWANSIYLDLSSNSFSHPIPDLFGKLQLLKYLDLSGNSFSGSIPQSLGTLSALEELRICGNQLNGTIPVSLGQLSSLKILDLSSNQ